jgi:hypothetical protein
MTSQDRSAHAAVTAARQLTTDARTRRSISTSMRPMRGDPVLGVLGPGAILESPPQPLTR